MTTVESYRKALENLKDSLTSGRDAREQRYLVDHDLALRESETVIAGLDGSNEMQRKADLFHKLETDSLTQELRELRRRLEKAISTSDATTEIIRHELKFYRLQLAFEYGIKEL